MALNLAISLEESVTNRQEKLALILGKTGLAYAGLRAAAKRFANTLVSLDV